MEPGEKGGYPVRWLDFLSCFVIMVDKRTADKTAKVPDISGRWTLPVTNVAMACAKKESSLPVRLSAWQNKKCRA
ncbi:hypothetical protein EDM54_08580 [Brevibacillus borstelensis]|nr:hypothetical protein X546_12115 [Brevibacillus borstelensis cifa_chp40]RNB63927.1 hypothetical protein EDM54_08580 [Brevibacillus borstelensis]GED52795.1 hypothetical protein BBO01nite_20360 [Brevibacillus borstelensis]